MNFTNPKKMLDSIISKTDKDGDGINDEHEQPIEGEDVNPIPKDGFFKRAFKTIRKTLAGNNTAGKITGFALDVFTFFAPAGSKIDKLRAKGKVALNLNQTDNEMKDIIGRILSKEGWKRILKFRDEDGNFDWREAIATILQSGVILGLIYAADYLGVLDTILTILGS